MLAWFAFGVPAAYWPGIPEAVQECKWAVIGAATLCLPWLKPRWSIVHSVALLLIGWAALSLLWAPSFTVGFDSICKMVFGLVLFVIGFETENLERFWIGCALGLLPSTLIAILQAFGVPVLEGAWWSPAGLFGNPNMMGEFAALVLIGLAALSAWAWVPTAFVAMALAQARGAFVAVIVAALLTRAKAGTALALMLAVLLALGITLSLQRNLASTDSLNDRLTIWRDAGSALTPIGHGIGSFATVMQSHNSRPTQIVQHAHNDALELAVELGVPGLVLAVVLFGLLMARAPTNCRLVLAALAVEAMFGFPLHNPATVFVGAVVAGHAARGWAGLRLREFVGGPALQRGHA